MFNLIVRKFKYGKHIVILETGMVARQANSSVMISMDDTKILVTIVVNEKPKVGQKFFPLIINYQERSYAAGRFPGGFFRREGRPSETEIFISRLIDRPIRPLFPQGFLNEIQIIVTVLSFDPQVNLDIVAIIGVSAALSLSSIPFKGPIGAARVGYIDNKYVLNPTFNELIFSKLDLIVSGTLDEILMVESEAKLLSEKQMLEAIIYGHNNQKVVINNINKLVKDFGKLKYNFKYQKLNLILKNLVYLLIKNRLYSVYCVYEKKERSFLINIIKFDMIDKLINNSLFINKHELELIFDNIIKNMMRKRILNRKLRIDGRKKNMIRELDIRTNILSRTHGSALFTRGETQVIVSVTLGTDCNAQNINYLSGEYTDRFLLHYNFLPFCVGEIGIIGSPKRREIGHGRLIKRGILAIIPNYEQFPYTIRVVSEVTESNGSSSMASICGASLALMDAGVPIKTPVAGVAIGLIKESNDFILISDISGDEDYIGDMDFKVSGGFFGITALQMDIKVKGITYEIIRLALNKAKASRLYILENMNKEINKPRDNISKFAPCIYIIKIDPKKIKDVIGKRGSVIRSLTEETGAIIEIEDNGIIKVSANINEKVCYAIRRIKEITIDIEVGHIYKGKVVRIVNFGAFILMDGGKEGLVHISKISSKYVEKVNEYLEINQKVLVKVLEIDQYGRIRLSIKDV
ncbi:MAG: polyribonucleotide nucleotidyltransferase [gamma proteobacterium endosymbiont of Trioza apicalis]